MNITFICTGNTCRSPMAEGIFKKKAAMQGLASLHCGSAGICAERGRPAAENAVRVCREIDVDISGHRSRLLTEEMTEQNDLVVVMTKDHEAILRSVGVPTEKIRVLGEGIPDPYGWDVDVYRMCRDSIAAAVDALLADLFGGEINAGDGDVR